MHIIKTSSIKNESEYRMIQKEGVDIEMLPDGLKQTGTLFRCVIFSWFSV